MNRKPELIVPQPRLSCQSYVRYEKARQKALAKMNKAIRQIEEVAKQATQIARQEYEKTRRKAWKAAVKKAA
jgi:hypothetical protein